MLTKCCRLHLFNLIDGDDELIYCLMINKYENSHNFHLQTTQCYDWHTELLMNTECLMLFPDWSIIGVLDNIFWWGLIYICHYKVNLFRNQWINQIKHQMSTFAWRFTIPPVKIVETQMISSNITFTINCLGARLYLFIQTQLYTYLFHTICKL